MWYKQTAEMQDCGGRKHVGLRILASTELWRSESVWKTKGTA
jgi:hypothetical protein